MRYGITAECKLMANTGPADLGDLIGPLMEALEKRGGQDIGVGTIENERVVEIDVSVVAEDLRTALDRAIVIVGGAIIDTGGNILGEVQKQIPDEVRAEEAMRQIARKAAEIHDSAHRGASVRHIKWSLDPDERDDLLADA